MIQIAKWTQFFAICVALSALGRAATITVKPGGAYPTIQDGVDAAGPGDTVLVKTGTYQETVGIPTGKFGLTIRASGKVVLDARGAGGAGAGPGFWIESPSVTIRGLTIRNAESDPNPPFRSGYGIECTQPGLTLNQLSFRANREGGVYVTNGDVATIDDCEFQSGGDALVVEGDSVTATHLTVMNCRGYGVKITGDSATVRRCTINNTQSEAIVVTGAGAVLEENEVRLANDSGIVLSGSGGTIRKCKVSGTRQTGINHNGGDVLIEQNLIDHSMGPGISHGGDRPTISDNRVSSSIGENEGIRIAGVATSGLVSGNQIDHCSGAGIRIESSCNGLSLVDNRVEHCGNASEAGFRIRGDGHILKSNRSTRNAQDGFDIHGDSVVLRKNRAVGNRQDGFDVSGGSGIRLVENLAKGNLAEGIENNASGTIIRHNRSVRNRIDFANDGSVATFSGNTIGDGSNRSTAPEID